MVLFGAVLLMMSLVTVWWQVLERTATAFDVFIPGYLAPKLVVLKDWSWNEKGGYVEVVWEVPGEDAIVRLRESKAREIDKEFLREQEKEKEDEWFVYTGVLLDGAKRGLVMRGKEDLAVKRTSYDPRSAPRLYLLEGNTFIELSTNKESIVPVEELIKMARSLRRD